MNKSKDQRKTTGRRDSAGRRAVLPALLAVGSGLAAVPAGALELGDATVQSSLGQPLRAGIAFVLGRNEQLASYCISVQPVANGLPAVTGAEISIANGVIALSGNSAIREPMMSARVVIDCPYTPHLSREYMLFIDPPGTAVVAPQTAVVAKPAQRAPARTATPTRTARPVATTPVGQGTRHRVQPGESLSLIAQRIEGRQVGLWDAVNSIFEANPDAFIDNDPNKLKAGSWLDIPAFGATSPGPAALASEAPATQPAVTTPDAGASLYNGAETLSPQAPADEVAGEEAAAGTDATMAPDETESPRPTEPAFANLQPGDVVLDSDVATSSSPGGIVDSSSIPDTQLIGPELASSPNGRTATVSTRATESQGSWTWMMWLAGAGIAIITALLLFGRRFRERFGSTPIGATSAHPLRRQSDHGTATVETLAVPDIEMEIAAAENAYDEIDFDLSDDSPTDENLALDADLVMGTGLERSTEMDVNQDFGFAVTTHLDMELPEHSAREDNADSETDIIPPPDRATKESILDSEVLPDDDEYDMSVIVDATKMPRPEDVTERDLKAIPVDEGSQTVISDDYTVSKEVDYEILEQDYEDEMTATQALNMEIEKAAAELAERMEQEEEALDDATTDMKLATVTELDVAAFSTAQNDEINNPDDDLAVTANIEADDKTVEMQASEDDETAEMPASDHDRTAEIEVEGGKIDTKAG